MRPVFIIAEGGSTHDGDLGKAMALIHAAAAAGADAIKFQTFRAKTLAARRGAPESIYAAYELPLEWVPTLKDAADAAGVEWMTTCYHADYLPLIRRYIKRWKIASFEAGDEDFVLAHLPYGLPVLISTGMVSALVLAWLKWLSGQKSEWDVRLLHCVSAYPPTLADLNLAAIRRHGLDGFSDHSGWVEAGGLAVAAGARIVETHLRLDETNPKNPDFPHSLTPACFRAYIRRIREVESAMGNGERDGPAKCEAEMARYRVLGHSA